MILLILQFLFQDLFPIQPQTELDDPEKRPRVWSPELWEEIWETMVVWLIYG